MFAELVACLAESLCNQQAVTDWSVDHWHDSACKHVCIMDVGSLGSLAGSFCKQFSCMSTISIHACRFHVCPPSACMVTWSCNCASGRQPRHAREPQVSTFDSCIIPMHGRPCVCNKMRTGRSCSLECLMSCQITATCRKDSCVTHTRCPRSTRHMRAITSHLTVVWHTSESVRQAEQNSAMLRSGINRHGINQRSKPVKFAATKLWHA